MELTYFLECTSLAETSSAKTGLSKTGFEAICGTNGKFALSSNQYILLYFMYMITVNYIMIHSTFVSELRVVYDAYNFIGNKDKFDEVTNVDYRRSTSH